MTDHATHPETGSRAAGLLLRVRRPGGLPDEEYYLAAGLTIGRTEANAVVLAGDPGVDRTHARVEPGPGGSAWLRCVGPDGTMEVGGTAVRELALAAGVRFRIGGAVFECVAGRRGATARAPVQGTACPFCGSADVRSDGAVARPCMGCGKPVLPVPAGPGRPDPVLVPAAYGAYRAERYAARGGMGVVLKGRPAGGGDPVAIKVILPGAGPDGGDVGRLRREAAAAARVRHRNVVGLLGGGRAGRFPYLVLEWVEGPTLADLIAEANRAGTRPDFGTAVKWMVRVCKGLAAVHAAGLVHRDLKPSNVLIAPGGVPRIADFGIARRVDGGVTAATTLGHLPGTYGYMAPEQLAGSGAVDGRADLYALGATFYELLTGAPPVGAWRPASELNPTVPQPFDRVLGLLLAPRPEDRYRDAGEVLAALAALKRAGASGAGPAIVGGGSDGRAPTEGDGADREAMATVPTSDADRGRFGSFRRRYAWVWPNVRVGARNGAVWGVCLLGTLAVLVGVPFCLITAAIGGPDTFVADFTRGFESSGAGVDLATEGLDAALGGMSLLVLCAVLVLFAITAGAVCGGLCGAFWGVVTAFDRDPVGARAIGFREVLGRTLAGARLAWQAYWHRGATPSTPRPQPPVPHETVDGSGTGGRGHRVSPVRAPGRGEPDHEAMLTSEATSIRHAASPWHPGLIFASMCLLGPGWGGMMAAWNWARLGLIGRCGRPIVLGLLGLGLHLFSLKLWPIWSFPSDLKYWRFAFVVAAVMAIDSLELRPQRPLYEQHRVAGGRRGSVWLLLLLAPVWFLTAYVPLLRIAGSVMARAASGHRERGDSYLRVDLFDEAIAEYDSAIRLAPTLAGAYADRAAARLLRAWRYHGPDADREVKAEAIEAIDDCERAIAIAPSVASFYFWRGSAWRQVGANDRALADLTRAITLDPMSAMAFVSRGTILGRSGAYDGAIRDFDAALRLDPNMVVAYNSRGLARYNKGELGLALDDFDSAVRLDPDDPVTLTNRGHCRQAMGAYDAAVQDFKAAQKSDPAKAERYGDLIKAAEEAKARANGSR
jgi:tetratricopeptide (TPR) repeat protein